MPAWPGGPAPGGARGGGGGAAGLPLVLFEAPHRCDALLAALERLVPETRVAACRELTKLHEEVLVGRPAEVRALLPEPRGELTLVISRLPTPEGDAAPIEATAPGAAGVRARPPPRTIVGVAG